MLHSCGFSADVELVSANLYFGIKCMAEKIKLSGASGTTLRTLYARAKESAGVTSDSVRKYTIASDGPYCDCGYRKKGAGIIPLDFFK